MVSPVTARLSIGTAYIDALLYMDQVEALCHVRNDITVQVLRFFWMTATGAHRKQYLGRVPMPLHKWSFTPEAKESITRHYMK